MLDRLVAFLSCAVFSVNVQCVDGRVAARLKCVLVQGM